MINVLVLALEFAPVQTTGAFRSVKLVKYLKNFGINPIVVTIAPDQSSRIFQAPLNAALLKDIGEGVQIYHLREIGRTRSQGRLRQYARIFLNFNDSFDRRFRRSLMDHTSAIRARHAIDAVYASLPPFGAAALAHRVSHTLDVPLLLDMRDAWSQWTAAPYPTAFHYWRRLGDERRAFSNADRIITVTRQLRTLFLESHPRLSPDKIVLIPNGFDGTEFVEGEAISFGGGEKLRIAYVGNYYYQPEAPRTAFSLLTRPHHILRFRPQEEDWSYRSPLFFFRAWQRLQQIDARCAERIEFHHIGSVPGWLRPMAKRYGIEDRCVFNGRVDHQAIPSMLADMDMVLATSMKRDAGGDYCLASKTFDYVASRKAILGFVTEGAQREFLRESGIAVLVDPDDRDSGAIVLRSLLSTGRTLRLNAAFVNEYHRRATAEKLAGILREVVRRRSSGAQDYPGADGYCRDG